MVRQLAFALLLAIVAERSAQAQQPGARPPANDAGSPAPSNGSSAVGTTVLPVAAPLGCEQLSTPEGLPNTNVRAIVQDSRGFIWLGTQDGLARYDGMQMRVYRPGNAPTSISSGYITALALDRSGKLWVGTAEHGVNIYDPDTDLFRRYTQESEGGLSSEGVTSIAHDLAGNTWLAMSGGGLNRFDSQAQTFVEYRTSPLDVPITTIDIDAAGTFWLGTATVGVIKWNPAGGQPVSIPAPADDRTAGSVAIQAILASSSGKVWVGTDGAGLLELDPATSTFVRHRNALAAPASNDHEQISTLFEDHRKNLWVGSPSGLTRIEPSGRRVHHEHDPDDRASLPFPAVESIYQDAGGVMWIGGLNGGTCKFDEYQLDFGHHTMRASTTHASSFHEDADGTLWVGTYNGGLYKYDRSNQRLTIYHSLGAPGEPGSVVLEKGWINAIHRDRRGMLWIAAKGQGLISFDTATEKVRQFLPDAEDASSLPVDSVWDIWEDERNMLWLATWGAGLVRFDPKLEVFTAFTAEADDQSGLESNHIYCLYPDPADKNVLWLGTAKGGLAQFAIDSGTAKSFRHRAEDPASMSSDDVLSIYRDPAGSVWAATYGGGLNRLELSSGKVERFQTSNSQLPNDVIFGVLPDDKGRLWLSTNGGGLVQYDPKTRIFLKYEKSDGAQDNEFGQGASLRSKSGELFFGGNGGFNAFFPRNIRRDPYAPPVAMTGFKTFNQEVKLDKPIWTLPTIGVQYSDSFELQFAALSFAAPKKNRYAYKLEGFDDKFIETDRPYATYTHLNGGNYVLRVRAANQHGAWNETGIALKLAVTPPLWRTWPAYGLYLLLLAGAAYLFVRFQRQKVRRVEREGRLAVVERDLELTGAVQTGFLPDHNEISTECFQVFGLYRPADACGGDWWWHSELSGGRHVVIVGDVTGHGPGPAMVTAAVATAFRVLLDNGLDDVTRALESLNREVLRVGKGKYHMTMAALELDEATGRWILYSAGAPPMLSLDKDGKHKVHFCAGAPLGTPTGFETGRLEGTLAPSDRILLYTDGIPEIALPNGNALGMRRFAQIYERTRPKELREAATEIVMHADESQGQEAQLDDWTFTIIEWTGKGDRGVASPA